MHQLHFLKENGTAPSSDDHEIRIPNTEEVVNSADLVFLGVYLMKAANSTAD